MDFIGRKSWHPKRQFVDLQDGDSVHGMSDGSWSFTDGILAMASRTGPCHLVVSTWTAAAADIRRANQLLDTGVFQSARFLVDRSFLTRQPSYCALLRDTFGDDSIRVWSAHAKFALLIGGAFDVLYLTSANLNKNKRLENFSVFCGGDLPSEYLALVEEMFEMQCPGEAFTTPALARKQMAKATKRSV